METPPTLMRYAAFFRNLSLSRKIGNTGSPNALLKKQLGLPATTHSWNTCAARSSSTTND